MSSSVKMVEAKLPPGFRFHPRDEELICDYLMRKLTRSELPPFLVEVDLNKSEPWDIPESACVGGKEWYFYSLRDRKYATGKRTNRATISGYWKATGKDRPVCRKRRLVGMRKTLVFYQGRAPKGKKTNWVMHEFRLEEPSEITISSKEDWVLCRVFHKNKEASSDDAKQDIQNDGSWYNQETNTSNIHASTHLPPLMDSYISFNQTHSHSHPQVPCFSNIYNFNNVQTTPNHITTLPIITNNVQLPLQNKPIISSGSANYLGNYSANTSSSRDNKMVRDEVINQYLAKIGDNVNADYTSMDSPPPCDVMMMIKDSPISFGEGSSESFLSEVGFPSISWNDQY